MNIRKYFGDINFFKSTLIIGVPLMVQQLINTAVNLVDNLMIGQLGDYTLAGVSAVNRYFMIALFGTMGVVAAASVFMAQFYGSNNHKKMQETFRYMIISSSIIMLIFIGISLLVPNEIIRFFVSDDRVILEGVRYMSIVTFSFIPTMLTMAIAGSMRAVGDTKAPLMASIASMATNLTLNYILIYGHFGFPKLGVVGAAIGTLIARSVELLIIGYALNKGTYTFRFHLSTLFRIPKKLIKSITLKALPLTINEVLYASGMALLLRFYGTRGADVISGYAITATVSDLFFTMNAGMSIATTILVSQPLGANKIDQARKNGYQLLGFGFVLSVIFGGLLFLSSFIIPHLYQVSENALWIAQNFLRIMSVLFWIYILNTTVYFILRAGGDSRSTLLIDSGYMWCVNLVVVGIATYYTNINIIGLYLIGQGTDVIKMIITMKFMHKEKWLVNLAEDDEAENQHLNMILE